MSTPDNTMSLTKISREMKERTLRLTFVYRCVGEQDTDLYFSRENLDTVGLQTNISDNITITGSDGTYSISSDFR